ncbi:hypothetical protein [Symmachiella dynata]|nr:hypothetical protein [Symmachiella dynata]
MSRIGDLYEAIGFPLIVWEYGGVVGANYFFIASLGIDLLFGAVLYWQAPFLFRDVLLEEPRESHEPRRTANQYAPASLLLPFCVAMLFGFLDWHLRWLLILVSVPAVVFVFGRCTPTINRKYVYGSVLGFLLLVYFLCPFDERPAIDVLAIRCFMAWGGQWSAYQVIRAFRMWYQQKSRIEC